MRLPRPVVRAVARAKPVVPDAAWPVLRTARSMLGQRPLLATPWFRRLLVLGAHPDDEAVGCGGLIALVAGRGCAVHVVVASDGDATIGSTHSAGETARRRRDETVQACRILGARPPTFLGHPDGQLAEHVGELAEAFARAVRDVGPDAVLVPWHHDGHPDHRAVTDALRKAVLPRNLEVWGYDTWTPLPPNRLVDVTAVHDLKEKAVAAHATAAGAFDLEALVALDRFRSAAATSGQGYVEGYLVATAERWFDLG